MNSISASNTTYDDSFFDYISIGSMRSAAIVAPLILEHYPLASLADIGCGRGAWLTKWQQAGITDYLGVDGSYVDQDNLLIARDRFVGQDLTKAFNLGRKFDLVISLEVGEHILPDATETFVDNLCSHADAILFSAAVPGQGGTFHVNEQNYEFWRQRFAARNYRLFDFLRHKIAARREVEPWFRYNSLFFARGDAVDRLSDEARASEVKLDEPVPNVAPVSWRLRNAVIRCLPTSITDWLVEVKHQFVRLRHG
ncbi:Methyltransferase domain-containing protein [Rhizobiales bacterium GAS188]|nr:Methyltransferase domain-containing protein [Rhizobiales bacterium GAS188]